MMMMMMMMMTMVFSKIEIDAGMVTLRQPLGHERRPAHSNGYTKSDTGPYPVQSRRPPASEAAAAHESQQ